MVDIPGAGIDDVARGLEDEFWGRYAPGRYVDLPGRGRTFIRELPGPSEDAPVAFLLHGWTATAALNWCVLMPELSKRYRVIAIDQRDHGRGIRANPFTLEDCADDVVAVMDRLGIEQAVVAGYSMGGPIAQLVWHRHPERVSGLVLSATSNNLNPRVPVLMPFQLAASALTKVPARLLRWAWPVDLHRVRPARWLDEISRDDPRGIVEAGAALATFESREWLPGVDVPVSVVMTTLDGLVPPANQLRMARLIPDARVFRVHADHISAPLGAGRWVEQMLRGFDSVHARLDSRRVWMDRQARRTARAARGVDGGMALGAA